MTALDALRAAGLGLGLGIVTGMPVAVVNVAIVDAASTGRRRFAAGLGLGGASADTIHAALAFSGVGHLVTTNPHLVRVLAIGAAVVIVGYVAMAWRRRRASPPPGERRAEHQIGGQIKGQAAHQIGGQAAHQIGGQIKGIQLKGIQLGRGVGTGFMLTLPNPAALGAWVAVAAAAWPHASPAEAGVIAGGVGVGSALWFTLLGHAIGRVRSDHPALALVRRGALILLVAIAAVGVVRAL